MKGARINFGVPNSEYVLLANDNGEATSLKNQDTGTEYIGGGGSSDFSTAQVTVISHSQDNILISAPVLYTGEYNYIDGVYEMDGVSTEGVFTIVLYKASAQIYIPVAVASISGDIENHEDGYYSISGDCTITIS